MISALTTRNLLIAKISGNNSPMSSRSLTTESRSHKRLAAVLLAAGESKRMGHVNKLLLDVGGQTFVRRTVEVVRRFPFAQILMVTGHESAQVAAEIHDPDVRVIENLNFARGMHSSIRSALENLKEGYEGFMICVCDQPYLSLPSIESLAAEFLRLEGPRVVFPMVNGQKGHPTFISHHFTSEILAEPDGDYGCSYLIKRHPNEAYPVVTADRSLTLDIDTPEEYASLGESP